MEKVANGNGAKKSYVNLEADCSVPNQSLPEIFEEAACREGQEYVTWYRPAERYTYKELYERAQQVAKGLMAIGMKRGDCILGVGCQGSDGVVMFMAATSIGLIFTCPYTYSPTHKTIASTINRVNPSLILVGDIKAGYLTERVFLTLNEILQDMSAVNSSLPLVYSDSISAKSDDCMKNNLFAQPLSSLIDKGISTSIAMLKEEMSKTGSNVPCIYTQTSGTTGEPKNVLIGTNFFTNGSLHTVRSERLHYTKESTVVGVINMVSDDVTFLDEFVQVMRFGCPIVVFPKPISYEDEDGVIQEICECIQKHRTTILNIDQYYMKAISLDSSYREHFDLSAVKSWIFGGSPIADTYKEEILRYYPETIECYGLSEIFWVTCAVLGINPKQLSSIGRLIGDTEGKICDENGNIVNRGDKGELLLKSPRLFLGYKDQPELTSSMYTDDGFFKTGDCVWMDEDGHLFFVGRMSKVERYKVSSDVVYAAPIENVLKTNKKIQECCVIGITAIAGSPDGHEICYCIVPHVADSMTIDEVTEFAMKEMSNQKEWPYRVVFMDKLPRHGSRQKVSKLKLIEDIQQQVHADESAYSVDFDILYGHKNNKEI